MVETIVFILLAIGILVSIISVFFVRRKRKLDGFEETNYKAFFILGITFLPLGIVLSITTDNPGFIGMSGLGAVYMIIGLSNKEKWKTS
jgi:LPXTG-motif cell wall-anchored protein